MNSALVVFLADYLIWIQFAVVLAHLSLKNDSKSILKIFAVAGLALFITQVTKYLFFVPRPFVLFGTSPLLSNVHDASFPSGHTSTSFGLSFSLYPRRPRLVFVSLLFSVLIGAARVTAGVHYLIDILGGIMNALVVNLVVTKLIRR